MLQVAVAAAEHCYDFDPANSDVLERYKADVDAEPGHAITRRSFPKH